MAGSGIRGAFEEKFKALIRDIEEEVRMLVKSHFQHLATYWIYKGRKRDLLH